jgi:hypothetical protein
MSSDILAEESRAVILGQLASRIRVSGKMIRSAFAIILTIGEGEITRFQMLDDCKQASKFDRDFCLSGAQGWPGPHRHFSIKEVAASFHAQCWTPDTCPTLDAG